LISAEDVRAAARTIAGAAHVTPVLRSRTLDEAARTKALLKCENFQRGGAFKFRGAFNKISSLTPAERAAGVMAYSSGNHAQAVALSASLIGARSLILMPEDTPASKREATIGYGAKVTTYDRYREDRVALGERIAREQGMTLIPPYDDPLIMAGQGTCALELLDEAGPVDTLVVPVGGGGLISGCATAARDGDAAVRVVGVEPQAADDTRRSLAAGRRVRIDVPRTIADGLQADTPGVLTFEVVRELVSEIVTVSDAEIVGAMAFLFETMKIVVEPSGAAAVAALLAGKLGDRGGTTGVVVSGGNVSVERFREFFS